jgi:hypothetical protein
MENLHTYFLTFPIMKSTMIAILIAGLTLVSGVSAMEMMDSGAMMTHDTMMSGSMTHDTMMSGSMTHDTMIKNDTMMIKDYARMSTVSLAKSMGYNWSKDRVMLANKAGIVGYRGTLKQNLMIRNYLMSIMKDKMMMVK